MISRNVSSFLFDSYVNLIVGCIELIFFMYTLSFSWVFVRIRKMSSMYLFHIMLICSLGFEHSRKQICILVPIANFGVFKGFCFVV